jgi:adenylate cyclase
MDARPPAGLLCFEEFRFDPRGGGLFRRDGAGAFATVPIGSRAADLLAILATRSGELITKQEIMATVWPGTVVEDHNLTVQISALRRILDAGRSEGSAIQTIQGRGYRFLPKVNRPEGGLSDRQRGADGDIGLCPQQGGHDPSAEALLRAEEAEAGNAPVPSLRRRLPTALWAGVGAIVVAALPGAYALYRAWVPAAQEPPRLSIVVLPFQNLGNDRAEDYLADGVTDDLTSDLSHIRQAFVIANVSARTYAGRPVDVKQIGQELGVRYVLEGSVQKLGDVLRVNAQLVSTEDGFHVWADRFDMPVKDPAEGQEAIVRRVVTALDTEMIDAESKRGTREHSGNPDSFDLVLRARSLDHNPPSTRRLAASLELYEKALALDPSSVPAKLGVADTLISGSLNYAGQWITGAEFERASRLIEEAAVSEPVAEEVLISRARLLEAQEKWGDVMPISQRIVELFPNNVEGYDLLASAFRFSGRADDSIAALAKAIKLNPRDPNVFHRYAYTGFALLMSGRYDESATWFEKSFAANPDAPVSILGTRYRNMAAALALGGHLDAARRAVAEADRLWPFVTVRMLSPHSSDNPAFVAQIARMTEGLRLAGVRDHAEEDADFGVPSDAALHDNLAGQTPLTAPGVTTIRTTDLARLRETSNPVVIDTMSYLWTKSITGAIGLRNAGLGGTVSDVVQGRLRAKLSALTRGDLTRPIVAVGYNSERFDGRNLALRLAAMGYTKVYWYRGGREAWEVAGLPEENLTEQNW